MNADEDFMVKQKAEWSAQSMQRNNELEATLQQKRDSIERLGKEIIAKTTDISKLQTELQDTELTLKSTKEERDKFDSDKKKLSEQQRKLNTERKNFDAEVQKLVEKARTQLAQERDQAETKKLMLCAGLFLVLGMLVAQVLI